MPDIFDFRSDTVTVPTVQMREVMCAAQVGDDVYEEDPTVNRLQVNVASLFGKEAALFVPTGTMSNQIAVGVHCQRGDEIITHPSFHVYEWEGGAPSMLWGASFRFIDTEDGFFNIEQCQSALRADEPHYPRSRLLWIENTLNRKGGQIYPLEKIIELSTWARSRNLKTHLDGARLWNAHIATQIPMSEYGKYFDSISVCFSKGLGAPIGSMLIGNKDFIAQAKRLRKALGGGMRQVGVMAAAAEYALNHHLADLVYDHNHATKIANTFCQYHGNHLKLSFGMPETNILWMEFIDQNVLKRFENYLLGKNIKISTRGNHLRIVTHRDITSQAIEKMLEAIAKFSSNIT